jgi:hypothetical protein
MIHRCGFSAHATAYAASLPAMSSISPPWGGTAAPARQHTELGPWFDARQARCQGVPGHSGGARKARRPRLHLYRRQRYSRHAGASAPAIERTLQLRACAQDHRQRPDGKRPRTRLHLGSGLRVGCVRQHGSRFSRHAGHLCRYRHGPPCRASAKSVGRCVAGISAGQQQCDRVLGVSGVMP